MLDDTLLVAVHPAILAREWDDDVVDMIEAANAKIPADMMGEPFDPNTIYSLCAAGMRQLWLVKRNGVLLGLGLTGIHSADITERRAMRLLLVVGRCWSAWAWTLGAIEAWGREQGCSVARIEGRKGWARRLPATYRLTGERSGAAGLVWERSLLDG